MEEKKKSTMRWILEWAGQKKMDYVWSISGEWDTLR